MTDKQEADTLISGGQRESSDAFQELPKQESGGVVTAESIKSSEFFRAEPNDSAVHSGAPEKASPVQNPVNPAFSPQSSPQQQQYLAIEKILEDDLAPMYAQMSPRQQQQFKVKGEEVTRTIFKMVYQETRIKVKKIISLIKKWLKLMPGINKYFLEQEAKIKADRIAELASREGKKIDF